MKMLTATARSQGSREGDFAWCVEGELVWAPEACSDRGWLHDTRTCGCERAFAGLASHRSTTTAFVRDIAGLTPALLVEMLRSSLADQGYPIAWAEDDAYELVRLAASLQVGDVIERHGDVVGRRFHPVSGQLLAPLGRRS